MEGSGSPGVRPHQTAACVNELEGAHAGLVWS